MLPTMATVTTERQRTIDRAVDLRVEARQAYGRRDYARQVACLKEAAELYRSVGLTGLARWCERFAK